MICRPRERLAKLKVTPHLDLHNRTPLLAFSRCRRTSGPKILVLVLAGLVHWLTAVDSAVAQAAKPKDAVIPGVSAAAGPVTAPLPAHVLEMRDAILAAVRSGHIEDLKVALEWNELKPDISDAMVEDPIAHWKKVSGDGEGREILAVLANILALPPAQTPLGKDIENNALYVWPYLAELPLDKLTPPQEVDLYRLIHPADAKQMRDKKSWTWWRLAIGADGTWHSFRKGD
jgi:hypothetical protein